MTDSERFERLERNIERLTTALLGDPAMGTQGLVDRIAERDEQTSAHERRLAALEAGRDREGEDREWVKSMRLNWSSPVRLIGAALGIAITAALGAFIARFFTK